MKKYSSKMDTSDSKTASLVALSPRLRTIGDLTGPSRVVQKWICGDFQIAVCEDPSCDACAVFREREETVVCLKGVLSELVRETRALRERVSDLERELDRVKYAPGGVAYVEAKHNFESCLISVSSETGSSSSSSCSATVTNCVSKHAGGGENDKDPFIRPLDSEDEPGIKTGGL